MKFWPYKVRFLRFFSCSRGKWILLIFFSCTQFLNLFQLLITVKPKSELLSPERVLPLCSERRLYTFSINLKEGINHEFE